MTPTPQDIASRAMTDAERFDTEKLTADARAAVTKAQVACVAADDGGSCNLDATVLHLPKGQRAGPVIVALRAAGLSCDVTRWLGRGVMVSPPGTGQAGKRYASNQAFYQHMRAAGWPVCPYNQMD